MVEQRVILGRVLLLGIALATLGVAAILLYLRYSFDDRAKAWPVTGLPRCDGFDFPVGAPDAAGYYDAQPFGQNEHLGNDWNGKGGGNTGLGDPVYATAAGIVIEAIDIGHDWGNVALGGGYGRDRTGYLDPTGYIRAHRP